MNIINNIFNLRDSEVVICIILVLFKDSRYARPLSNYQIVYKAIIRHNSAQP